MKIKKLNWRIRHFCNAPAGLRPGASFGWTALRNAVFGLRRTCFYKLFSDMVWPLLGNFRCL